MSSLTKYHMYTLCVLVAGLFLICTELRDRVERMAGLHSEIGVKEELTAESLVAREKVLQAKEEDLTSLLSQTGEEYDQSETGVIEFLHAAARMNRAMVETLVPSAVRRVDGNLMEIPIALDARGSFRELGGFLSAMERAPFLLHVAKCEVKRAEGAKGALSAHIETTAVIVGKGGT